MGIIKVNFLVVLIMLVGLVSCTTDTGPSALTLDMTRSFVEESNRGTPRAVDEFTILENVQGEHLDVIYNYKVMPETPYFNKEEQTDRLLDLFKNYMCATPKFHDKLLQNGVRLIYRYLNSEGALISEYAFTINNC